MMIAKVIDTKSKNKQRRIITYLSGTLLFFLIAMFSEAYARLEVKITNKTTAEIDISTIYLSKHGKWVARPGISDKKLTWSVEHKSWWVGTRDLTTKVTITFGGSTAAAHDTCIITAKSSFKNVPTHEVFYMTCEKGLYSIGNRSRGDSPNANPHFTGDFLKKTSK